MLLLKLFTQLVYTFIINDIPLQSTKLVSYSCRMSIIVELLLIIIGLNPLIIDIICSLCYIILDRVSTPSDPLSILKKEV